MRRVSDAAMVAAGLLLLSGCSTISTPSTDIAKAEAVETSDIDRFWSVYDRLKATTDHAAQISLVQTEYLDRGSAGLTAFATSKGCTAEKYTDLIRATPRFWESIRPRSEAARNLTVAIAPELAKFRQIYPEMRPAKMYFLVGCLTSAGTAKGDKVMFGTELVMGNDQVDISEMPEARKKFLGGFYATDPQKGLNILAIHEYVHTQQKEPADNLLAQTVTEGAADFVTEQVTGKLPALEYASFGPAHSAEIKARFQRDLAEGKAGGWLYVGVDSSPFGVRDLGYYVGYAICKSYYDKASDKRLALKHIIELDTANMTTVNDFVAASGYFST